MFSNIQLALGPRLRRLACIVFIFGLAADGFVAEALASDAGEMSAGMDHTCALRSNGAIACFGYGETGALNAPAGAFVQVSAGWHLSCALRANGTAACWGTSDLAPLAPNPPAGSFTEVSAGGEHACGLRQDGSIECWGASSYGRLLAPSGSFTAVSAGLYHSCALRQDQTVVCWGLLSSGVDQVPAGPFIAISAGGYHACAVRTDNTMACWGGWDDPMPSPPGQYASVSAGGFHTCAVRTDGLLSCWGATSYGQSFAPAGSFRGVTAGWIHTCGERSDGTRACWGHGYFGKAPLLGLAPGSLPTAHRDLPYAQQFILYNAWGTDYTPPTPAFAVVSGALPAGMELTAAGLLVGTPTVAGQFPFTMEAEDANRFTASMAVTLVVEPPSDSSAPTITPSINGTLGNNGWYTSETSLSWSVTDAQSTVSSKIGCEPAVVTADSSGVEFTCTASSAGGSNSASVTIKRDATAPTLSPAVSPHTLLLHGSGSATANASDALSGVATQSCNAPDATTVGSRSVPCSAVDNAGNSATGLASYAVVYGFVGFASPVDNAPTVNAANAGQAIPFKWRLTDANAAPVLNLGSVALGVANVTCNNGAVVDALEQYASDASPLQNLGNGYYQYNWKSPKSYQGTCKQLSVDLGDGAARTALFRFK